MIMPLTNMNIYCPRGHRNVTLTAILAFLLFMTSCNSVNNKELAEQGVAQFHSQLNAAQYHAIYTESDEQFRRISNETDFAALVQSIHRKLGKVQQSNLQSFQVGWFIGQGTMVTLIYNTQFVEGKAGEKFTWRIKNNRPILVGYFINSNVLVVK